MTKGNGVEAAARLYLAVFDWKVQTFCWPKRTSLECAQSIYVKITAAACGICRWNVSLGDSYIGRVRDRLDILSLLAVRVVDLEYS